MKTISGKRMSNILKKNGWVLSRVTGSHHIFIKENNNLRITVPIHGNKDLKNGLQKAIMKQALISEKEL